MTPTFMALGGDVNDGFKQKLIPESSRGKFLPQQAVLPLFLPEMFARFLSVPICQDLTDSMPHTKANVVGGGATPFRKVIIIS